MILALRQKFDILEDKLICFHVVRWSHFLHGERFMGPVIHNIWRTYHVVSPHANWILPQHHSAGAPSLRPKLSAARDDWDCFKDIQASSIFFFFFLRIFSSSQNDNWCSLTSLRGWHNSSNKRKPECHLIPRFSPLACRYLFIEIRLAFPPASTVYAKLN